MITAKDDFMFDRELMEGLISLAYQAGLSNEEIAKEFDGVETVAQYNDLQKRLLDMQVSELELVRRGETLSAKKINKAVNQAANRDE